MLVFDQISDSSMTPTCRAADVDANTTIATDQHDISLNWIGMAGMRLDRLAYPIQRHIISDNPPHFAFPAHGL